ncbi:ATP-binding protein [Chloroflexota bacterium]
MWEHCIQIDKDTCNGCGLCDRVCPGDILQMIDQKAVAVYPDECWHCGSCIDDCPVDAIRILPWMLR